MRVKKMNEVVELVAGTEDEVSDIINQVFDSELGINELTEEEAAYIDSRIFKCICCHFYFYKSEEAGNSECCLFCNETFLEED